MSLSEEDSAALDRYVEQASLESRSAGVQQAIRRLPDPQLEADYAAAWQEWPPQEVQTRGPQPFWTGSPILRSEILLVDLDPAGDCEANKRTADGLQSSS